MNIVQDTIGIPSTVRSITFSSEILRRLLLPSNQLAMLPAIAEQTLESIQREGLGDDDLVWMIGRDPLLAAKILHAANRMKVPTRSSVLDLRDAVVRLGYQQCESLIVSTCNAPTTRLVPLDEEWTREVLSVHGFTTAFLATVVNREMGIGFQGEEFTAGLIHDIGRLVLATSWHDRFAEFDSLEFEEEVDQLAREEEVIGTNHCEVGAWFTSHFSLPEQLTAVVRYHHAPELAHPSDQKLVALIGACDHMANYLQRHDDAAGYRLRNNLALQFLEQRGIPDLTERLENVFANLMNSARREAIETLVL